MLSYAQNRTAKFVAIALLWLVPGGIFYQALHRGWEPVWNALGVHSVAPPFLDLRVVTSGVQTYQHGGDPLVSNPFDQLQRSMNYPRAWLYAFRLLHLNDHNAWLVGLLFSALYLLCISKLIAEARSVPEQFTLLVASLSIAALFAMERGNIDLPVFAIVFLSTLLGKPWQRAGALLVATLLKLFPVAALAAEVARQRGRKRIWPATFLGVACVALAAQWSDLRLIARGTPVIQYAGYGVLSIRETVWLFLLQHPLAGRNGFYIAFAAVLCCLLSGLIVALCAWRRGIRIEGELLQSRASERFFLFGAIYVLTFIIGSNWDYRLIFLIPTLPFAFTLLRSRTHFRWGVSYVVGVLLAENCVAFEGGYKTLVAEVLTTAVFFLALTMLVRDLKAFVEAEKLSVTPLPAEPAVL